MGEYTISGIVAVVGVVLLEVLWLRTRLFRAKPYWISIVIVVFFQSLVDGWLTKRPHPIVEYNEQFTSGIRFPFAIPIEDWLFGFALITLALLFWKKSEPH